MLRGIEIVRDSSGPFVDEVILDHEGRHRRRVLLCGSSGTEFLLDLADVPDLRDGDGIVLSSGQMVRVRAVMEPLMEIRCVDAMQLARIAWHVGNRHLPAEIGDGVIRLRSDHVIANMLESLGAEVRYLNGPFNPESGAYANRDAASEDLANHRYDNNHHHG